MRPWAGVPPGWYNCDMRLGMVTALVCTGVLAGCVDHAALRPSGKVLVAVTVLPHAWLVQQIGGEHVEVMTLVRPGENAELYQPTDDEISRASRAAVIFQTGMPLESAPGFQALRRMGTARVVDLRQGIALRPLEAGQHGHHLPGEDAKLSADTPAGQREGGQTLETSRTLTKPAGSDPHIWLSLRRLKIQARTVARELAVVDPAHQVDYQRNLAALEVRLEEADASIRRMLAPHRGKAFLVFHPAWGYFAEDYGLRQLAIESEGKEPSDHELTQLQQLARREDIRVVFVHPQGGKRSAEAVARALGARVEVIDDLPVDLLAGLEHAARCLAESFP